MHIEQPTTPGALIVTENVKDVQTRARKLSAGRETSMHIACGNTRLRITNHFIIIITCRAEKRKFHGSPSHTITRVLDQVCVFVKIVQCRQAIHVFVSWGSLCLLFIKFTSCQQAVKFISLKACSNNCHFLRLLSLINERFHLFSEGLPD